MGQWLTHQVVVEVLGDNRELFGDGLKFLRGHHLRRSGRAGAEGAIAVAEIGDLHIDPGIGELFTQNNTLSFRRGGW